MKKIISFGILAGFAPMFAFAVGQTAVGLVGVLQTLIGIIIPALIALAVLYFIWGIISYMLSSDEEAKKASRDHIIKGIISLFIIFAFWGIISVIKNSLGIQNESGPNTPLVPCPYGVSPGGALNCY